MTSRALTAALGLAVASVASPAMGQKIEAGLSGPAEVAPAVAAPVAAAPSAAVYANDDVPDPTKLTMPQLAFTATPVDEQGYEKYFYFHREETSFAEAYADIKECDALASGISFYVNNSGAMAGAMAQYSVLAAGIGSALGSAIADAIFGSAERRKLRRVNLRNCMSFKGYRRYGLSHELWEAFNFEEGMGRKREGLRENALQIQALVASGPKPMTKELGL